MNSLATAPCITTPGFGAPVTVGTSPNVFYQAKKALLLSDIEGATTGPTFSHTYISGTYSVTPGNGFFENFVVTSGDTTNFFDSSNELYLVNAGGTCEFTLLLAAMDGVPAPDPVFAGAGFYPGTWTVTSSGQTTIYLEATP